MVILKLEAQIFGLFLEECDRESDQENWKIVKIEIDSNSVFVPRSGIGWEKCMAVCTYPTAEVWTVISTNSQVGSIRLLAVALQNSELSLTRINTFLTINIKILVSHNANICNPDAWSPD